MKRNFIQLLATISICMAVLCIANTTFAENTKSNSENFFIEEFINFDDLSKNFAYYYNDSPIDSANISQQNFFNDFVRLVRVITEILQVYPIPAIIFNISVGNWSFFIDLAIFTYEKLLEFDFGILQIIIDLFIMIFWQFFSGGFAYQVCDGTIIVDSDLTEGSFLKRMTYSNLIVFDMIQSWSDYIIEMNIDTSNWSDDYHFKHFMEYTLWNQYNLAINK